MSSEPSLLQPEQPQYSLPLLRGVMLHPSKHLCSPPLDPCPSRKCEAHFGDLSWKIRCFNSEIIETVCCSIPLLKILSESMKPNLTVSDSAHQHDLQKGFGVNVLDLGCLPSERQAEVLLVGGGAVDTWKSILCQQFQKGGSLCSSEMSCAAIAHEGALAGSLGSS